MDISKILNFKFPEFKNTFFIWEESGKQFFKWDSAIMGRRKPTEAELAEWEKELPSELEDLKRDRITAIDEKTSELILRGFEFEGERFSMSDNAQKNWTMLAAARANKMMQFPYPISTLNESIFILKSDPDLLAFLAAYATYQADPMQPLGSGRSLKAKVTACETVEEVLAIVDDRE